MQVIRYNIFAVRKEDSIELGMSGWNIGNPPIRVIGAVERPSGACQAIY